MQSVTSLFNTLWSGSHRAVVKAVINDSITIGEDKITNLKTDGALFAENDFSFGGCISRQFEMSFYPGNITIPRMAKVQLYMQLTNGTQTSEWISKGIFYIDTRETDSNGLMKITGYDAMLKTEQDFIPTSTPQSMQATASQIATAIGVSLDSRCVFQNYNCQLVTGYSMREILGFIAGVHGGNWIITDTGNLRLVRTSSSVDSFTITNRELMSYNRGSTYASVTKVIINIDDETYVEAGNTTGRTVEVNCPWATTAMAQALLTQLGSVSYTPCTASVLLHPAAEIGDKFVVSSISHSIATQTIHFNSLFLSELEVPGEEEIDHEYPFESASERTANRKIAAVVAETAELRVTTQQISARVEDVEGDVATISLTVTSLTSRITSAEGDISDLEQTATSLTSRITSAEGDITTLEQTTTSISATVSGKADKTAGAASTFSYSLTATGFTLSSKGNEVMSVTSSGANIGGWVITASKLYHPHGTGNDGVGLVYSGGASRPSLWQSGNSPVVFYAGARDDNPYPDSTSDCYFGVLADGSVYCQALKATGATITGSITATSGTIGGCSIVNGALQVPVANITGTITASAIEVKNGSYTYFKAGNGAVQIGGFNVDNNSLYSGSSFSSSAVFLCTGSTGTMTIAGHSGTNWALKAGSNFGVNTSGELYCTSATLTGNITATSGKIGNLLIADGYLYYGAGTEDAGIKITSDHIWVKSISSNNGSIGAWTINSNGLNSYYRDYDLSTFCEPRLRADVLAFYEQNLHTETYSCTWRKLIYTIWTLENGSDSRVKNSIEILPERYDTFFDKLSPKRYKYNNGNSGRFHTGFIAQEVVSALESSGLTTNEFAAVMLDHIGETGEQWYLRRDEFVSLNTWQIQKLKARVAHLEELLTAQGVQI